MPTTPQQCREEAEELAQTAMKELRLSFPMDEPPTPREEAEVAVAAVDPLIRKQAQEEERERLGKFIEVVTFEVGCMRSYANEKPGMLGKLAGEMAEPLEAALDTLDSEDPGDA